MNWDRIEGKWMQIKGMMKEELGKITDNQWNILDGQRDQRAGKTQESYGIGVDEMDRKLRQSQRSNNRSAYL